MRKITTKPYILAFLILIVFGLGLSLSPGIVGAATLELNPPSGTYVVGSSIPVDVFAESTDQNVNAISARIRYDTRLLGAVSVSKDNSIVDLWLQEPSVVARDGVVIFEGLILNPGFSGTGKIITINFEVKGEGRSEVEFSSGLVLANDGFGTNIVEALRGSLFNLVSSKDNTGPGSSVPLPPSDTITDEDEGDSLLAPVVISYNQRPRDIEELTIRGVSYPDAVVNIYLQDSQGELTKSQIVTDPGGNFVYDHGSDNSQSQLAVANVFSILDALSQPRTADTYQFWLTAVQEGVESESTQSFDVFVGNNTGLILALSLILLAAAIVLVYYLLHTKSKKVLTEMKKDIDSLSFDIEKYEAKDRQDAHKDQFDIK